MKSEFIGRWIAGVMVALLIYRFMISDSLIDDNLGGIPLREGGLIKAVVWGSKSDLDSKVMAGFREMGIIHLLVISGSNVMLFARIVIEKTAEWLGRKTAIVSGVLVMWLYVSKVGFEIPVVRAGLWVTLLYLAQFSGKKYDFGRGFLAIFGLMILASPQIILEMSWWLTLTAVLGMQLSFGRGLITDSLWMGWWMWPILVLLFGKVSLGGVIFTILISGLIGWVTVGALGVWLAAGLCIWFEWCWWILWGLVWPIAELGERMSEIGWLSIGFEVNWVLVVGVYLLTLGWRLGWRKKYGF